VLEWIVEQAWSTIEHREQQRLFEQTRFISAQHTSSKVIDVQASLAIVLVSSQATGHLCFCYGQCHEEHVLLCYDSHVDEMIYQVKLDYALKQMLVFKSDEAAHETIYYLSVIDHLGYWRLLAYRNQQVYLLFTQHEGEVGHGQEQRHV
jgi:hypothetical protein